MGAKQYGTPGPRSIYPEMCDSRSLARCSVLANALWPRLIVRADDQGRMAGDPADVLGECFPKMLSRVKLTALRDALDELEQAGMIRRYEVGGETYLQIVQWWSWQAYGRRAYPSRLPAPEGWTDVVYGLPGEPRTYREAVGLDPRKRRPEEPEEESAPEPQHADPTPRANRTLPAREPHAAGTVPAAEPHSAGTGTTSRARDPVPSRPVPSRPSPELERADSSLAPARANGDLFGDQPPDDPLLVVRGWLSQRRADIDPGGRAGTELARLVDRHGSEAVIAAMAALGPGLTDGRQYVYGASKALAPIPDVRRAPPTRGYQRSEAEVAAAFARDAEELDRAITR